MPPALSDDEGSDVSVGAVTTPPPTKRPKKVTSYATPDDEDDAASSDDKGKKRRSTSRTNGSSTAAAKAKAAPPPPAEDDADDDDDDDDDDDMDVDEYEVQEIVAHTIDKDRNPRFHVKWKGYDDPADYTWEPEDNLADNAADILNEYLSKIGGREKLYEKPAKGKKRGRPSAAAAAASAAGTPSSTTSKRARKSDVHPADRETPSSAVAKEFKPPAGSWEDDVVDVEMFRDDKSELRVYLTWKNGEKTQHAAQQAYVRCPQRILHFYESRISFKAATE